MNNTRLWACGLVAILALHSAAFALPVLQTVPSVSTSAIAPVAIKAGTRIPARINKDMKDGDVTVTYTITDDVRDASGNVLIPKDSTGYGKIVQYRRPTMWGGPGKTEVSLDSIATADGKQLTVTSKSTKYGRDSRIAALLFSPFVVGFFLTGGSGKVGTGVNMTFTAQ